MTKIELDLDDPTDAKVSVLTRTAADSEFGTMVGTSAQNEKPIYFLEGDLYRPAGLYSAAESLTRISHAPVRVRGK